MSGRLTVTEVLIVSTWVYRDARLLQKSERDRRKHDEGQEFVEELRDLSFLSVVFTFLTEIQLKSAYFSSYAKLSEAMLMNEFSDVFIVIPKDRHQEDVISCLN